jgi:hypothetical protein
MSRADDLRAAVDGLARALGVCPVDLYAGGSDAVGGLHNIEGRSLAEVAAAYSALGADCGRLDVFDGAGCLRGWAAADGSWGAR